MDLVNELMDTGKAQDEVVSVDPNFVSLDAYADVAAGLEDSNSTAVAMDLLYSAQAEVERSMSFDSDMTARGLDTPQTLVASTEGLRGSLAIIGINPETVVISTEDAASAAKDKEGMLTKIWAGIKKGAEKAWKILVELVTRAVNFVKGLIGKKESTAASLREMLTKMKEEGKVNLPKDAKFEEMTVNRLGKDMSIFLFTGAKKITPEFVTGVIKEQSALPKRFSTLTYSTVELKDSFSTNAEESKKTILDYLTTMQTTFDNKNTSTGTIATAAFDALMKKDNRLSGGKFVFTGAVSEITATKVVISYFGAEKEPLQQAIDKLKNAKNEELFKVVGEVAKSTQSLIFIGKETFKVEKDDIPKDAVTPLSYDESSKLVEELESATKTLTGEIDKIKKAVQESEKSAKKTMAQIDKFVAASGKEKLAVAGANFGKAQIRVATSGIQAASTGAISTVNAILRSGFGHLVTESAKLYVKEEK